MMLFGGIGLFLLGMIVMTNGLHECAGDAMRRALIRFTRTPASGALTGAITTAVVQSSSATTVAAVGFVGAGILSFPSALGIIFGANIGTTITGWMVALLGFKLQLGQLAYPIVFAGAVLRLVGRGRLAGAGLALAGFGLLFVGIALMQDGMLGARDYFDLSDMSADGLEGRLLLVFFGIGFTLVTQSSSAGVAAALTALHGDLIDFTQAATLVIGMDVGTTITAALAAVASSASGRRTGLSHVMYNAMTGVMALCLIDAYVLALETFSAGLLPANAEFALVGFHTLFNALGVILVLPFTRPFARLMERLVPGTSPSYTQPLEPALIADPESALTAVLATTRMEFVTLLNYLANAADASGGRPPQQILDELDTALEETSAYLDEIHVKDENGACWERLIRTIRVLDHLQRLLDRCEETPAGLTNPPPRSPLPELIGQACRQWEAIRTAVAHDDWLLASRLARADMEQTDAKIAETRTRLMFQIGAGEIAMTAGNEALSTARWLNRTSKHVQRVTEHYAGAQLAAGR